MRKFVAFGSMFLTLTLLGTQRAQAVNGAGTVATNGFPFVVRITEETGGGTGTGSYITNGVVLTAAHCVTFGQQISGAVTNFGGQSSNRVTINGQQYFALGVVDPLYAAPTDANDIGLFLVLNAPGAPAGGFPTLATTADAPLTTGNTIKVLGFGLSPAGGLPIFGTMTMTNFAGDVTYNQYTFHRPPSVNMTDGGDSGGPYLFKFGATEKIVGVHTFGNVTTVSGGTRVDNHYDFIIGNGQTNGVSSPATLVRLGGAGNTSWNTPASWKRASTNFPAVPQGNDIAILDPTGGSDSGTTVNLDIDPPELYGLLNDVTLNVDSHTLNVVSNGVLNGGKIAVGGAAASTLNVTTKLDNEGTVTIGKNATASIAAAQPAIYSTYNLGLFNGSNATFTVSAGGNLTVHNANGHTLLLNSDASSTLSVQGDGTDAGTITADRVDNYGLFKIGEHSSVLLNNLIFNEIPGRLQISGGANGNATGDVFQLFNWGSVSVNTGGVVIADVKISNFGSIGITGGSIFTTNFTLSFVTNFAANLQATAAAATTAAVTMTSGNIGVTNALTRGTLDVQTGTFTMNGGNLSADRLLVTNTAGLFSLNGGVVTSSFTQVANGIPFTVGSNAVAAVLNLVGIGFGANHSFSNALNIAVTADSTGTVFFSGNQLTATNGTSTVGLRGVGQLVVTNGGTFFGNNLVVASTNGAQGTFITTGGGAVSQLGGSLTVGDLTGSSGTVSVLSAQLLVTNASTLIGNGGFGQLTATNGVVLFRDVMVGVTNGGQGSVALYNNLTTIAQPLSVGSQTGATGSVLVAGGQLTILATSTVFGVLIGDAGVGSLIVSNANVPIGTTVTVVGNTNGGQGYLGVAGGTVTVNSLAIGEENGATGTVFVSAGELNATNGTTGIAVRGVGSMTVTGGLVRMSNILCANSGGSDGTLSVSGGQVLLSDFMVAGDGPFAKGALWITGGQFTAPNALVIIGRDSLGLMTVSNGVGSIGTLTVASDFGGDGSLTMAGGTLTIGNWLHVADHLVSTGSVLVTGGSLSITNGPTIIGNLGSGRLTISNVTVRTRDVTIAAQLGSHGTLTLNNGTLATVSLVNNTNGFIMGVGTIDGPVTNAGTISPGFSPGKIFITGKLTLQPTSTVVMELGGTADADYDHIIISNALQADGTLDVSLINAFNPANGDTFDIFGFTSSGGEFSITNLPALNPGLSWDTSQLMTIGEIAVVPEPSSLLLVFAGGGLGVLALRRKSRRTAGRSS